MECLHKTEYNEMVTVREELKLCKVAKRIDNCKLKDEEINVKFNKKVSTVWTNFKLVLGGEKVICLHCAEKTLLLVSKTVPKISYLID